MKEAGGDDVTMAVSAHQRCIRQTLEAMVMCCVCRGRLHAPRLLRCRHSACLKCLTSWLHGDLEDGATVAALHLHAADPETISCPSCRALTLLPPGGGGVASLPVDFNKNILLDILDMSAEGGSLPGSSRRWCTVCDITGRRGVGPKTPATAFCGHCQDHLCAPCLEEHASLPLLKDHNVTITPHGSHLSVLLCRDHRNKSLDFYCHNCVKLICGICLRTHHRDHLAEGADDVSENRKRDIICHKRALVVRLAALKADGRAFNIDRRALAKHRVASFQSIRRISFDVVSAMAMMESLVHFCDYLLTMADPGEVVAAADHVQSRSEQLLSETAPDDFTDQIIALLCRARTEPVMVVPNPSRANGAGSLTSDDRSSDVTDDASFIGSDPGGIVTDIEESLDEADPGDFVPEQGDAPDEGGMGTIEGRFDERQRSNADNGHDAIQPVDADCTGPAVRIAASIEVSEGPKSDVTKETTSLLWRCSINGPDVGQVDAPWDVAFMENGDVITTELVNTRVQIFSDNGRESRVVMSGFEPRGVSIAPDGTIAVVDHTKHCIHLLPPGGDPDDAVLWKPQHVAAPEVVAFAPNGHRVVTDAGKHVVAVYNSDGEHLQTIGERGNGNGQFRQPVYTSISSKGKVIVGDVHNNRIQAFTLEGKYLGKAGKRGSGNGNLYYPRGVCWDDSDHVVVADSNNSRVTVFDHDGRWRRHLLTEKQGLRKTRGVSVTAFGGDTLVAVTDRDSEYSSLTVWKVQ